MKNKFAIKSCKTPNVKVCNVFLTQLYSIELYYSNKVAVPAHWACTEVCKRLVVQHLHKKKMMENGKSSLT